MSDNIHLDPEKRHDFIYLFDVTDGNPNGDPDAGNLPRVDPETMQGLVTDVAVKRKIRDYVDAANGEEARYKIYVQHRGILTESHSRAYEELDEEPVGTNISNEDERRRVDKSRAWMCHNFYDVRTFGAVMSVEVNCGQVRGPLQLTFARSIDPVVPMDVSITRVAVTNEKQAYGDSDEESGRIGTMGRKAILPYGLYRGHGFFNPMLAEDTGFDSSDLELFWQALKMCWELDRSAARGLMALRGLYVFSHDNALGNAPTHELFERVDIELRDGVQAPRSFGDYDVRVQSEDLPEGITLTKLLA